MTFHLLPKENKKGIKMKYIIIAALFLLSACDSEQDSLAKKSGQSIQVSDDNGIKLFKVWRDNNWVYYSVDAKKVQWTTQYQCGGHFAPSGKSLVWIPVYCDKQNETHGEGK